MVSSTAASWKTFKAKADVDEDFGYGDSEEEYLRITRGKYSAWGYVVAAFIIQSLMFGGLLGGMWQSQRDQVLTDGMWGAMHAIGAVISYLMYRDRWRCIEAFSSAYCTGLVNLSLITALPAAGIYGFYRGIRKLFGK